MSENAQLNNAFALIKKDTETLHANAHREKEREPLGAGIKIRV